MSITVTPCQSLSVAALDEVVNKTCTEQHGRRLTMLARTVGATSVERPPLLGATKTNIDLALARSARCTANLIVWLSSGPDEFELCRRYLLRADRVCA